MYENKFMYDNNFALRISKLRTQKGVSARDMSLSIGQNAGYINNIETGKALPSMTSFFYICEYLDITPQEFFDADRIHYRQDGKAGLPLYRQSVPFQFVTAILLNIQNN